MAQQPDMGPSAAIRQPGKTPSSLETKVPADLPQGCAALVEVEVIGAGQQWAHIAAREGNAFGMQFVCYPPHLFGRLSFSSNCTTHPVRRVVLRNLKTQIWKMASDGGFGVAEALDDPG